MLRTKSLTLELRRQFSWGYANGVKVYHLWCLNNSKFVISWDVTFDENSIVALSKARLPINTSVETPKNKVVDRPTGFYSYTKEIS